MASNCFPLATHQLSIGGIGFVTEVKEPSAAQLDRATKTLGSSIVFSALRCTLQYIVLPFVLPWLGMTGTVSLVISLVLEGLAVGIIVYNIIALWPTNWRWRYLGLGTVMLFILGVFLYNDLQTLYIG